MSTPTNEPHEFPKCFGVVGWKNSGKTTMTVRLVEALTARGYRVSTVKHAHHTFRLDDGATDSARHRKAGAAQVGIVSAERWALITDQPTEADTMTALDAMLRRLEPADLVLVEGFKDAAIPKLEVRRQSAANHTPLWPHDPMIVAVATDVSELVDPSAPAVFEIDAIEQLADFIERHHALSKFGTGS